MASSLRGTPPPSYCNWGSSCRYVTVGVIQSLPVVLEGHTEGGNNTDELLSFIFLLNLANIRQTAMTKEGHGVPTVGIPITTDSPCNYRNPAHEKSIPLYFTSVSLHSSEKKRPRGTTPHRSKAVHPPFVTTPLSSSTPMRITFALKHAMIVCFKPLCFKCTLKYS